MPDCISDLHSATKSVKKIKITWLVNTREYADDKWLTSQRECQFAENGPKLSTGTFKEWYSIYIDLHGNHITTLYAFVLT